MTKYEDLIKQTNDKDSSVDSIAKKYKMGVLDVRIIQEWKDKYEKEYKLRQEAEGELTIVKGISVHMSPEMRDADKEINNLKNDIANLKETIKYFYSQIQPHDCGWMYTTVDGLKYRIKELRKELRARP